MKIDTQTAAKKLGVSVSVVRKMAVNGQLTDLGETQYGRNRHHYVFDNKEVKEFAASHVRDGKKWVPIAAGQTKPRVKKALQAAPKPVKDSVEVRASNGSGKLFQRLEAIERQLTKLDRLIDLLG